MFGAGETRPNVPRQNDSVGLAFGTGGGLESYRITTPFASASVHMLKVLKSLPACAQAQASNTELCSVLGRGLASARLAVPRLGGARHMYLVGGRGLEPPLLSEYGPKPYASTISPPAHQIHTTCFTTPAYCYRR